MADAPEPHLSETKARKALTWVLRALKVADGLAPSFPCAICAHMLFEVSIVEKQPDGMNDIRVLLKTTDVEEANALVHALEQDGVKCRFEVIPPARKRR